MALESRPPTESPRAESDDSVPSSLREADGETHIFGIHVVVVIIVGLCLCFIAFIAWQISLMPPPPG